MIPALLRECRACEAPFGQGDHLLAIAALKRRREQKWRGLLRSDQLGGLVPPSSLTSTTLCWLPLWRRAALIRRPMPPPAPGDYATLSFSLICIGGEWGIGSGEKEITCPLSIPFLHRFPIFLFTFPDSFPRPCPISEAIARSRRVLSGNSAGAKIPGSKRQRRSGRNKRSDPCGRARRCSRAEDRR